MGELNPFIRPERIQNGCCRCPADIRLVGSMRRISAFILWTGLITGWATASFDHPEPAGKNLFSLSDGVEGASAPAATVSFAGDAVDSLGLDAHLLIDGTHASILEFDLRAIIDHVGTHPFVINSVELELIASGSTGNGKFSLRRLALGRDGFDEATMTGQWLENAVPSWRGNLLSDAAVDNGTLKFERSNSFRHAVMDAIHGVGGKLRLAIVLENGTGAGFASDDAVDVASRPVLRVEITVFQEIRQFPADARVYDITQLFGAKGDGITDDTAALNMALGFAGENMLYLPEGTYRVTGPLRWPAPYGGARKILIGEHRDRTVIRLADNAAGFQNATNPVPLIWTGNSADNANRFYNSVTHLTIDVGSGNPGANGIAYQANNRGTLRNVRIVAGQGSGVIGLDLANDRNNGPNLVQYVAIEGFETGIRCGGYFGATPWPGLQNTLEHIVLSGQRMTGLVNISNTVSARSLIFKAQGGVAVRNQLGHMVLLDSVAYGVGTVNSPAVVAEAGGHLLVRDLLTTGYTTTLETPGARFTGYVKEWTSEPVGSLFASTHHGTLDIYVGETPFLRWRDPATWTNLSGKSAAQIQELIDAGATTLYIPGGSQIHLNSAIRFRNKVERVIGLGNSAALSGDGTDYLIIEDTVGEVLVFDSVDNGAPWVATRSNVVHSAMETAVVFQQCTISGLKSLGTGSLFLEGVIAAGKEHPFSFEGGGKVFARSYNNEVGDVFTVVDNATDVWMFGYKTEEPGTVLNLHAGSRAELLGALIFAVKDAGTPPIIQAEDSQFTISFFEDIIGNPYLNLVEETRNGETRIQERTGIGNAGVTRTFPIRGSASALFSGQNTGPYRTARPLLSRAMISDHVEYFGSGFRYFPMLGDPHYHGWCYELSLGWLWLPGGSIDNVYAWSATHSSWIYTNATVYPWYYHFDTAQWQRAQ